MRRTGILKPLDLAANLRVDSQIWMLNPQRRNLRARLKVLVQVWHRPHPATVPFPAPAPSTPLRRNRLVLSQPDVPTHHTSCYINRFALPRLNRYQCHVYIIHKPSSSSVCNMHSGKSEILVRLARRELYRLQALRCWGCRCRRLPHATHHCHSLPRINDLQMRKGGNLSYPGLTSMDLYACT
jgi:hypothetical protein